MLITKCYPQKSNILKGSMAHHMLMRTWLLCLTKVGPLSPNNPMPKRDRHLYRWLNQPVFWAKSLQSQMFGYLFLLPHNIWYISQHNYPSVYIPLCDYYSGVYNVYIPQRMSRSFHRFLLPRRHVPWLHTQFLQAAAVLQRNSWRLTVADEKWPAGHGPWWVSQQWCNGDFMWFSIGFNQ